MRRPEMLSVIRVTSQRSDLNQLVLFVGLTTLLALGSMMGMKILRSKSPSVTGYSRGQAYAFCAGALVSSVVTLIFFIRWVF